MVRPLFLLGAGVALVVAISSAFLQVETVKPPHRVESSDPVTLDRLTGRQNRIATLIRNNDTVRLAELNFADNDLAAAESRVAAEEAIAQIRTVAKEQLGPDYTGTFLSGTTVIVTATTAASVPGAATVVVVPHSLAELRRIRRAIDRHIADRGLAETAEVRVRTRGGNRVVEVCAPDDAPLDLSAYPSSAVKWVACDERS